MSHRDRLVRSRRRRGFTLVELLVALVVGAIVLFGARLMLEATGDAAHAIARQATWNDREANADRVARTIIASLEARQIGGSAFVGDERRARFASWCDNPGGWQEQCAVNLTIAGDQGNGRFELSMAGSLPLVLRMGFTHGELRYLIDATNGGRWLRSWQSGYSVPRAIGVVLDTDTLIYRVGERG